MAILAGALLVATLLAGCNGNGPSPTTSPSTSPSTSSSLSPMPAFDGAAALDFVQGFALRPDGTPRHRMPGSVGQAEGAAYLWQETDLPGWTRHWQNFTGADFLALPNRPAAAYEKGGPCTPSDEERLPALPFHNIVAVRAGAPEGAPTLLLGAHWDSLFGSYADDLSNQSVPYPGANDGASGVGLLLQLMRELADVDLPFGVAVIFLDGEDGFNDCYPLVGSTYHSRNLLVPVHRFLLLDMVGSPDARFIREAQSEASDPALVALLWQKGRQAHGASGAVHFTERRTHITDDHTAFIAVGIPSVDLIDAGRATPTGFPPEWHTTRDTVDRLSTQTLALVGDTLLAALQDPAFLARWPGRAQS